MSLKLPRNWDFSTFKAETARIARSRSVMPGEGIPNPDSPGSSRSTERPLKAGWLKKQHRSIVKNWHQRYFILRGCTLTYHKDDKESTIQGVIQLMFSKVNELPLSSDDPGKYLFEIIPCGSRNRDNLPYIFMANSQTDKEEWVRVLRRAIGVPASGVFGKSLPDTVAYEQRFGPHLVPILVQKCTEYIREEGLNEEGIFRLPGQDNIVKQFRDAFDAGERPSFPSGTDVHTVASLFKLYLRELPEPVVPWIQYQDFLDCTCTLDLNSTLVQDKLEKQIALLPRVNYNLLGYICRFLFEVQLNSKVNKMNVENLATVMGINLLKPQIEDPITMMKATPQIQRLMTMMIRQHEALFPPSKDILPSPPTSKAVSKRNNAPRSFVGWETAEMCDASLSESPGEEEDNEDLYQDGGDCSSKCSNSWSGSPRKRTQTMPTLNCPLPGVLAKAEALNRGSRIQESVEEQSGTLAEDIFKILDLKKCLLFASPQTTATKEEDTAVDCKGSDIVSSFDGAPRPDGDQWDAQMRSYHQSVEALKVTASVLQSNSRAESQKESQQHSKQLIESLKQENKELKASVSKLQAALEVERCHVAILETRLRNVKCSQDKAPRNQQELDKWVQELPMRKPQASSSNFKRLPKSFDL